mgnify:CR=1 FL=1
MKLIMENWNKFLKEGITDVVFHKTRLDLAADILEKDKFMTSVAFGTPADMAVNKKKLYYFSTMRSPSGEYYKPMPSVTFKLDGRKLGEKSKASAVDYWGPDYPTDEMEDRVFTNEPYLEPASRYISEIHIGIEIKPKQKHRPARIKEVEKINKIAKSKGIPVFMYTEPKTFEILNKAKRLSFEEWMELFNKEGRAHLDEPWDFKSRPWGKYSQLPPLAKLIQDIDSGRSLDDIDKSTDSQWYKIKYDWGGEYARQLQVEIHNQKSNPEARESISVIGKKMKFLKTDLPGLINWIQEKIKGWAKK